MKRILPLFALLCCALSPSAQNLNVAFRSKMTFPNQTIANVWGYTTDGREYALVGGSKGLIVVDITQPDTPVQVVQVPGPQSLWKEIKTYSHYAYTVSEGGGGIQVVDLQNLPAPNLGYHSIYPHFGADSLVKAHALHIDETKGFLYIYGANTNAGSLFGGGAVVFDLKADPYNPVYVGKFSQLNYIHDGYVDNDTLYSSHIYAGNFAIVDMSNKAQPLLIGSQVTPTMFTHNTWLTRDRKTILATDETANSYLSSWDVSDPADIKYLDKIQSNPGTNSAVHNTHIRDNWAITAWYKDGVVITDVTKPDNLVNVGNYDTYAGSGQGFEGCWGVYPFFPSGNLVATTIKALNTQNGEIWVLTPNLQRACYLEGNITDGVTGDPINGTTIEITGTATAQDLSGADGVYRMGQELPEAVTVRFSKSGYQEVEAQVTLQRGEVVTLDVALFPVGNIFIDGQVVRADNGAGVPHAQVMVTGAAQAWPVTTDEVGYFKVPNLSPGVYSITASKILVGHGSVLQEKVSANQSFTIPLKTSRN